MIRNMSEKEQRIEIQQVEYDIMSTQKNNLDLQDIETLTHLFDDMNKGEYVDIQQYNLSGAAIDFIIKTMRKALCPDKQEE